MVEHVGRVAGLGPQFAGQRDLHERLRTVVLVLHEGDALVAPAVLETVLARRADASRDYVEKESAGVCQVLAHAEVVVVEIGPQGVHGVGRHVEIDDLRRTPAAVCQQLRDGDARAGDGRLRLLREHGLRLGQALEQPRLGVEDDVAVCAGQQADLHVHHAQAAQVPRTVGRAHDLVARIGGDALVDASVHGRHRAQRRQVLAVVCRSGQGSLVGRNNAGLGKAGKRLLLREIAILEREVRRAVFGGHLVYLRVELGQTHQVRRRDERRRAALQIERVALTEHVRGVAVCEGGRHGQLPLLA